MNYIVWFSCGAASFTAAALAIKKYNNVDIVYCDTGGEHESNILFLKQAQEKLKRKITILKNDKYKNHFDVYRKKKFISNVQGAPCTKILKRELRVKYQNPDDTHIFGYTAEEKKRAVNFDMRNPELTEWILIDEGITKGDCLGYIWQKGLDIPLMYKLGYNHNNCIGCCKGGQGYWNKIRVDFPASFNEMAKIERELNYSCTGIFLDQLDPTAGNFPAESSISCGIGCYEIVKK